MNPMCTMRRPHSRALMILSRVSSFILMYNICLLYNFVNCYGLCINGLQKTSPIPLNEIPCRSEPQPRCSAVPASLKTQAKFFFGERARRSLIFTAILLIINYKLYTICMLLFILQFNNFCTIFLKKPKCNSANISFE